MMRVRRASMVVSSNVARLGVVAALLGASIVAAHAQATPDRESGRYTFSPNGDRSLLRLDSRTGSVSICKRSASGWACYATPDERDAFDLEVGRLQTENARLKERLAKNEAEARAAQAPAAGEQPKADDPPKADKPVPPSAGSDKKLELPLPDDRD